MVFIPRAQPHAQSLFLFPIFFGNILIHFFDEKKDGAVGNSIVCFAASIPGSKGALSRHLTGVPVTPFDSGANFTKNANCFEENNVFGKGKCELSAIQDGRN